MINSILNAFSWLLSQLGSVFWNIMASAFGWVGSMVASAIGSAWSGVQALIPSDMQFFGLPFASVVGGFFPAQFIFYVLLFMIGIEITSLLFKMICALL